VAKAAADPTRAEPGIGEPVPRLGAPDDPADHCRLPLFSLTAWWGFMFWYVQQMRGLEGAGGPGRRRPWTNWSASRFRNDRLVDRRELLRRLYGAGRIGYRQSDRPHVPCVLRGPVRSLPHTPRPRRLALADSLGGFLFGVFGLFTRYLPPLFPTLLEARVLGSAIISDG